MSIATWCTRRKIGPVVVVDEVGRHALEATDKNKIEGMKVVSTTVPDPPEARGVKGAPETSKESPRRNAGIVARKTTGRASAGRRRLIQINPD